MGRCGISIDKLVVSTGQEVSMRRLKAGESLWTGLGPERLFRQAEGPGVSIYELKVREPQ